MSEFTAISKVSTELKISSRTLRYWEASGLFTSLRDTQSGWRIYDDHAVQCIRITNLLRHLDFSIKDIKEIIEKQTVATLCTVLKKQLSKLNQAGSELKIRKEAISELIDILEDETTLSLSSLENIIFPVATERKKHVIQKLQGGFKMESIKSKFDEVSYINLAPARAVAFNAIGISPEGEAYEPVTKWLDENNLTGTARIYLFNVDPWPSEQQPEYGMGCCATIPENIEIPEHLYEMRLPGGTYAVISQYDGDPSYGWKKLDALMDDGDWEWQYDESRPPGLEEHIETADGGFIIPILLPVKKK